MIPVVLAAACAALLALRPVSLETSLYDLVGDAAASVPSAVRNHSSNLVPVVVSSEDADLARTAADDLFAKLPSDGCQAVRYRFDGEGLAEVFDACLARRAGLVSDRDAELLATPEGRARLARAAALPAGGGSVLPSRQLRLFSAVRLFGVEAQRRRANR